MHYLDAKCYSRPWPFLPVFLQGLDIADLNTYFVVPVLSNTNQNLGPATMKFSGQKSFDLQVWVKSVGVTGSMDRLQRKLPQFSGKIKSIQPGNAMKQTGHRFLGLLEYVKCIGLSADLEDYEKRKLGIFNLLNFYQVITGILVPLAALFGEKKLHGLAWLIACSPAFISILVLWLNATYRHEVALISYFVLYPVATSIVYLSGMSLGTE